MCPGRVNKFEHLIGLMKSSFHKTVVHGLLSWEKLSEVIQDIKVTMNLPLCYLEGDLQLLTLTQNALFFLNTSFLPELQPYHLQERDLRKRTKFLQKMKDAMWAVDSRVFTHATRTPSPEEWEQGVFPLCERCGDNQGARTTLQKLATWYCLVMPAWGKTQRSLKIASWAPPTLNAGGLHITHYIVTCHYLSFRSLTA